MLPAECAALGEETIQDIIFVHNQNILEFSKGKGGHNFDFSSIFEMLTAIISLTSIILQLFLKNPQEKNTDLIEELLEKIR